MKMNEKSEYAIEADQLIKKYKNFTLDIPEFQLPKGFISVLIGENGAGKSTFLQVLAGARLNYKGNVKYFEDQKSINDCDVRDRIGYTAPGNYFMPHWTGNQIKELAKELYPSFSEDEFDRLCQEMSISGFSDQISRMSDGNRMKLELASVLARDTDLLIMDEPASPLDPLMREKLCDLMRNYIANGNGEKTVFLSTHNISDLAAAVDYCYFMADGKIIEKGSAEDLKDKYILVNGPSSSLPSIRDLLISSTHGENNFSGLALTSEKEKILYAYEAENSSEEPSSYIGDNSLAIEAPTLEQISVGLLRKYSHIS